MKFRLIIAFLFFCSIARAQTANVIITPAHLKAAEDVLIASGAGTQMKQNISTMVKQASANVPDDKKAKFTEIMNTFLTKYLNYL